MRTHPVAHIAYVCTAIAVDIVEYIVVEYVYCRIRLRAQNEQYADTCTVVEDICI
jgi:hypothetical protein